jgi:competence protein ComGC
MMRGSRVLRSILNKPDEVVIIFVIVMLILVLIHRYFRNTQTTTNEGKEISIERLIEQVKSSLEIADAKRMEEKKAALFKVDSFELEINFIVKEAQSGEASIRYEAVTVGGRTEVSAEKVQKIILHMKAIDYDSPDPTIKGNQEFVPIPRPVK